MTKLIIIEANSNYNIDKLRNIFEHDNLNYKVYYEPNNNLEKEEIFSDYGEAIKDKGREKEISLWDKAEMADWNKENDYD